MQSSFILFDFSSTRLFTSLSANLHSIISIDQAISVCFYRSLFTSIGLFVYSSLFLSISAVIVLLLVKNILDMPISLFRDIKVHLKIRNLMIKTHHLHHCIYKCFKKVFFKYNFVLFCLQITCFLFKLSLKLNFLMYTSFYLLFLFLNVFLIFNISFY